MFLSRLNEINGGCEKILPVFAFVTRRPYCPGKPKKLCFTTLSLAPTVLTARLCVVKQSFFVLPGQYGRRVTKANLEHFEVILSFLEWLISLRGCVSQQLICNRCQHKANPSLACLQRLSCISDKLWNRAYDVIKFCSFSYCYTGVSPTKRITAGGVVPTKSILWTSLSRTTLITWSFRCQSLLRDEAGCGTLCLSFTTSKNN